MRLARGLQHLRRRRPAPGRSAPLRFGRLEIDPAAATGDRTVQFSFPDGSTFSYTAPVDQQLFLIVDGYGSSGNGLFNITGVNGGNVVGNEDMSFDLVWDSRGRLTATGWQVEVVIPFAFREAEDGAWSAGLGDLVLATKWALLFSHRTGSIVSMAAEVILPTGGFDGLMETADGDVLVSSWDGSAIYRVKPDGAISTAAENLPAPTDFAWDAGRGVIVVPLFTSDAVVILPPM